MARRITGQAIGLVLGGGGARGLAHLGVIKALNEVGVPVDMVGGTSQGAYVGALLARNPDDPTQLTKCAHEMAREMGSTFNKLRDLTVRIWFSHVRVLHSSPPLTFTYAIFPAKFPLTSYFSGHHFNRV